MTDESSRYFNDKTVLVTGGAGAIGGNLSRALADLGAKAVIILADLSSAYEWNIPSGSNVLFVKGDIRDDVALKRVFKLRPTVVYHLAAFFANQNSVDYPEKDLSVGLGGTLKILEYTALTKVDRFVFAGSSGCYGADAPLPLKEDLMSMYLSTPYQVSKVAGALYCNFYHRHYGLPVVKPRFFNSYGPGEVPGQYRNVIPNFVYWAMLGMPLPLTGAGAATRDFTYVDDIVDGLLRSAWSEGAIGADINIASGKEIAIKELADRINTLVGSTAGIRTVEQRKWDNKDRRLASIERATKLLGFTPRTSIDKGLALTVDWFKANWDRIKASAEFPPGVSPAVSGLTVRRDSSQSKG